METQTVNLPIVVPLYNYCWEYGVARTCQYFSNKGGHNKCALDLGKQEDTIVGVAKAYKCRTLVTTQTGWQPIETVDRNKSVLILFEGYAYEAKYDDIDNTWTVPLPEGQEWYELFLHGKTEREFGITHWMEIPLC